MFPESEYHRDFAMKYNPGYSYDSFKQTLRDPSRFSLAYHLVTPDERQIFNQNTQRPYKYYAIIPALIFIPFFNKIPYLKNIKMLRVPLAVMSLAVPIIQNKYYQRKFEEVVFQLYLLKREQYKKYKLTGDIRHMNRFVNLVDE